MGNRTRTQLYTALDLRAGNNVGPLIELARAHPFGATRFDSVENARHRLDDDSMGDAAALLTSDGFLFLLDDGGETQIMIQRFRKTLHAIFVFVAADVLLGGHASAWKDFSVNLFEKSDALYGYTHDEEQFRKTNYDVQSFEQGGRATRGIGIALREFRQALPGVYWRNFFRAATVKQFAQSDVSALDGWRADRPSGELVLIQAEGPANSGATICEDQAEELREAIGRQRLFARNADPSSLQQFPELVEAWQ